MSPYHVADSEGPMLCPRYQVSVVAERDSSLFMMSQIQWIRDKAIEAEPPQFGVPLVRE